VTHRAFTVDEANALLPNVRVTLHELARLHEVAAGLADQLAILDALWGDAVERETNPDHGEFLEHHSQLADLSSEAEGIVRRRLVDRGIRFPAGGLQNGLVDFPTTLDGRWVYLCWQLDEPEVRFWHEPRAGFRGRRQITAEERKRMGRPDDPAHDDDSALDF